jgi:hypothetical protein
MMLYGDVVVEVRRIARRWFPEALLDIGDGRPEPIDESKVIDVAKVERAAGIEHGVLHGTADPSSPCIGRMWLFHNDTGGGYLRCDLCNKTLPPPQEARDIMRGTPEHLTIAGAAEPVLEPGERTLSDEEFEALTLLGEGHSHAGDALAESAPVSAVQSESERDTLNGEDVVAVPASVEAVAAEAPIPVPAAPASNQAMRDAVYQHWIKPRPTANKIEMRGLLDEHGWHGDQSLGDWMLTLTDDQLAKIGDAIKDIP